MFDKVKNGGCGRLTDHPVKKGLALLSGACFEGDEGSVEEPLTLLALTERFLFDEPPKEGPDGSKRPVLPIFDLI